MECVWGFKMRNNEKNVQQVVGAVAISFSANERGRHDKKKFCIHDGAKKRVNCVFFSKK